MGLRGICRLQSAIREREHMLPNTGEGSMYGKMPAVGAMQSKAQWEDIYQTKATVP